MNLIAGVAALVSGLALWDDQTARQSHTKFMEKMELNQGDSTHFFSEGVVVSQSPIENQNPPNKSVELVLMKTQTQLQQTHSYTNMQPVFETPGLTLTAPVTNTVKTWGQPTINHEYARDIQLGDHALILTDKTNAEWDSETTNVTNDNVKITNFGLKNNSFRCVFGTKLLQQQAEPKRSMVHVNYIGSKAYVENQIRYNLHGVDDGKSLAIGSVFLVSVACLLYGNNNNK